MSAEQKEEYLLCFTPVESSDFSISSLLSELEDKKLWIYKAKPSEILNFYNLELFNNWCSHSN